MVTKGNQKQKTKEKFEIRPKKESMANIVHESEIRLNFC